MLNEAMTFCKGMVPRSCALRIFMLSTVIVVS